ncbi:MAG: LuxR C-terminal-related transcriptional regulator [Chloroflexota bacterium]|nr:LuxR C-terminal-related transcriptional regulator [Chloroflexota bacterium]MDQ5864818.1 LuxR C-terminal-related transcriptional regulator [Chloroflexota bacterium]
MPTPILNTKLYIPPPPPKVVLRTRLIERLNAGLHRKLSLACAPAGFGKTTLLSAWAASCNQQVAWLSLEEGDSDPVRFLTYLIEALRRVAPNNQEGLLAALQSPQPPPVESILTTLLNQLTTLAGNLLLVLDDYHVIDSRPVDQVLTFLVEHLPPQMHLAIATREDPQLPLARLRARGQLTELRAKDLRFTPSEAASFLHTMGLSLSAEDVAALESRTEGWIAGLQLAYLSMQGHENVSGFIRQFAGDNRYIVDYLVEEVLQRQPEPVRSFLLQTSILDRLNGPLCDAVTGQEQGKGKAQLEALERGGFFVVPLDDRRVWFRFHALFAEVLQVRLLESSEQPYQVTTLHRRASEWYEQHGWTVDAMRHALSAQDFERAADLVEGALPAMRRSRQETVLLGWFKALPDELFRFRPVLSVGYAGVLMATGQFAGVEDLLRNAERWLSTLNRSVTLDSLHTMDTINKTVDTVNVSERTQQRPELPSADPYETDKMVVVDKEEFRRLPGAIAMYRAALAHVSGDVPGTMKYARLVLDGAPEDDHLHRGAAAAFIGLSYWASGDLEAAHRIYAEGMTRVQRAGYISDTLGSAITLADIRIAQGRLHEAMSTYEWALQLALQSAQPETGLSAEFGAEHAMERGEPVVRGTADLYVGMSAIHRERNDLDAATQHLMRSKELVERTGIAELPQNPYRWRVAMALIREAQGDLDGALDLLHEAERLYVSDFSPNVRPISALRARVWIAQGRLGEALAWVRERSLSPEDDLSYLREFEHITLTRVLLARYKSDSDNYGGHPGNGAGRSLLDAMALLKRLLKAAEEGGRRGSVIEILVLQALTLQLKGEISAAIAPLQEALTLAEPEGYVRRFVDEGPPMGALLREATKGGPTPNYVRQLLASFGKVEDPVPSAQLLFEPLSERELEVLRLLRSELSGPEVARELMVSLNTMHTHTKNIYTKLGVNNRRAAVRRAEELHVL